MAEQMLREPGVSMVRGGPLEQIEDPQSVPIIYTNSVQLKLSLFDLTLLIGQTVDSDEERTQVKPLIRIVMSPQHAKALATLLSGHVRGYEQTFGPLPNTPIDPLPNTPIDRPTAPPPPS